ncbi:serine/threonine-protein phosphatase 4 regulatory subunit 4-like isoform X2 [Agrilus planipennis]|uniref:Serine/threonine-protein phosphatase 4 regulatory subunit 4-like isoform X2 n=1 Tax=Agrilus planipennis TaxID=224129 RepID=A0A1W4WFG5_AGRPL|nr:serine/threonine-protein phosphatase 4 regulatory subunit 4-like isoform X2 [Agrilus planipennis]
MLTYTWEIGSLATNKYFKGDDIQKISVIQSLPQLLQSNAQAVHSRVIPKIQQDLPNSSSEFNIIVSKTYKALIQKKIPIDAMNAVYQGIESRDPVVSNAWFDTLIDVVNVLDEAQVKGKVLPFARDKSSLNQPLYHRVASCRIFGAAAGYAKFSSADVKREVLPSAQSLCQDCHPEVRGAIATQIPLIMKGLGSSPEKSVLLPCLVELANDEKVPVRSAAVSAIVGCLPYLTHETVKDTIVPLVKRLYEKYLEATDSTTVMLAKDMGAIMRTIEPYLTSSVVEWYLKTYKTLAAKGKPASVRETLISQAVMCRDHCAANLPTLAEITLVKIPDKFDLFYATFKSLAGDPCYIIRRTVAEHFHEVSDLIGSRNNTLKPELINLLKDDVDEIVQALVMNLDLTLQSFTTQRYLSKRNSEPMTLEIGNALLKCQNHLVKGNNWRLLTNFLNRLQYLTNCMPSDYLHQNFTPTILNIATEGRAKPVRLEACRTLLWFLSNNVKETQRQWLRDSLISNLCYSPSFYSRQIFVKLCSDALEIFNSKYFKDYFFIPLISLIDDKIPNIRYGIVLLMPRLRLTLTTQDSVLHKLYNNALQKLKFNEKDRDVKRCFEANKKDLEGPISPTVLENMAKLEKKKQDSEQTMYLRRISDTVYQKTTLPTENINNQTIRPPTAASGNKPSNNNIVRSTNEKTPTSNLSTPKVTSSNTKGDMTFLEQHFYVDAGIVFPTSSSSSNSSNNNNNNDCSTSVKVHKEKVLINKPDQQVTLNVTDDDKYKIRMKSLQLNYTNINDTRGIPNKRHSSFYPSEGFGSINDKIEKRKSLDITLKENSKIPVCLKTNTLRHDKSMEAFRKLNVKAIKPNVTTNSQSKCISSLDTKNTSNKSNSSKENRYRTSLLPVAKV